VKMPRTTTLLIAVTAAILLALVVLVSHQGPGMDAYSQGIADLLNQIPGVHAYVPGHPCNTSEQPSLRKELQP
jgi:hypothetical protein